MRYKQGKEKTTHYNFCLLSMQRDPHLPSLIVDFRSMSFATTNIKITTKTLCLTYPSKGKSKFEVQPR